MTDKTIDICTSCLKQHPSTGWPWPLYDKPVYWSLPDDGAKFECHDCKQRKSHKLVLLTQIPCGHRLVICTECIDKYWLSIADNMGEYDK